MTKSVRLRPENESNIGVATKKASQIIDLQGFLKVVGGLDGTRTRGPLRDRQVF